MKRILLLMVVVALSIGQSRAQMTFKKLIESIDWDMTESQVLKKYPDIVRKCTHYYNRQYGTRVDYEFHHVDFAGKQVVVSIEVGIASGKLIQLTMGHSKELGKLKSMRAQRDFDEKMTTIFGVGKNMGGDDKGVLAMTKWTLPSCDINVLHMYHDYAYLCNATVTKGKANKKGSDFRKSNWGDSYAKVKSVEGKRNVYPNNKEMYVVKTTVADFSCYLTYYFVEDKFVMARYALATEHSNKEDYVDDYNTLVSLLTSKYGKPYSNSKKYKKDVYKMGAGYYGFQVGQGDLTFNAEWKTDEVFIRMNLYGQDYEVINDLSYVSVKYASLVQKIFNEKVSDDL